MRPDTHLTYMINIALTAEFSLAAGGARWAVRIGSSGGRLHLPCLAQVRQLATIGRRIALAIDPGEDRLNDQNQ